MNASRIPTKAEEIAVLKEAAEKLGKFSYCGNWLTSLIPNIDLTIRSDGSVEEYDLRKMQAECLQMKTDAEMQASAIIASAELQAQAIREAGRKTLESHRDYAVHELMQALKALRAC